MLVYVIEEMCRVKDYFFNCFSLCSVQPVIIWTSFLSIFAYFSYACLLEKIWSYLMQSIFKFMPFDDTQKSLFLI